MLRTGFLILAMALPASGVAASAEEIPLETCDRLPVVQVSISGAKFLFLIDTAATSMLNVKSFAHGQIRKMSVTSWSGTMETSAQEVTVADFAVGEHHFKSMRLPAIDLSGIGRACGRRIDGILGVDLLGKLGAIVEFKDRSARLLMDAQNRDSQNTDTRVEELHGQLVQCEQAFNRSDEAAFADCLDEQVVIFTIAGDYYGREAAMQYYRSRYFRAHPPAHLAITPRAHHPLGEAMWVEYDLRITLGQQVILARGTALCKKEEQGKWRIVHMNHSSPPANRQ
jgi:ketosteroid isomerase-like protein